MKRFNFVKGQNEKSTITQKPNLHTFVEPEGLRTLQKPQTSAYFFVLRLLKICGFSKE
jgi:hypothetical protein